MQKILEKLYDEYGYNKKMYEEERSQILTNEKKLKKSLNKYERKLLLRIQDDKDLIIEKTGEDSFINGVNVGVKLMLETLYMEFEPDSC